MDLSNLEVTTESPIVDWLGLEKVEVSFHENLEQSTSGHVVNSMTTISTTARLFELVSKLYPKQGSKENGTITELVKVFHCIFFKTNF